MYPRRTTTSGFGGGFGGFGISGPMPRDLAVLLGVLFVTYSLQFFAATQIVPALLRLTPLAWQRGFVWQLATYPFAGYGSPSLWFVLELLILYMFGKDVFFGMGRRHFWRLVLRASLVAAAVAVLVNVLGTLAGGGLVGSAPFGLMQGQRMLLTIFVAAFATANSRAQILLFFVLPIEARWFLLLEILFAFIGFLQTHDLAGFLGICTAVAVTYNSIAHGSGRGIGLREIRLRLERRWIAWKLDRNRRKRGLRVIPGEGRGPDRGGDVRKGPWVH